MRPEDVLLDLLDLRGKAVGMFPVPATITAFNVGSASEPDTVDLELDVESGGVAPDGLKKVPLMQPPGWGDWEVIAHPAIGDRALVLFCARDIHLWYSGAKGLPELRQPDLVTAIVVGRVRRGSSAASGTDSGALTLRKHDGSVSLVMSDDGVAVTGDLEVNGSLAVAGTIEANGDIKAGCILPATTVSLLTHTHSGVTAGSDPSGPPVPGA